MQDEAKTNWAAVDALTEEQIIAAAMSDPDNLPLTEEDLASMREIPRVTTLRRAMRLSAEEFAERYRIPLETLLDWEAEKAEPDPVAKAYLRVIALQPEVVADALTRHAGAGVARAA